MPISSIFLKILKFSLKQLGTGSGVKILGTKLFTKVNSVHEFEALYLERITVSL